MIRCSLIGVLFSMTLRILAAVLLIVSWAASSQAQDEENVTISESHTDADGFLVHAVQSPYQEGSTEIRVLLPEPLAEGRRYPVVYVLPVEAGRKTRFGDGLLEVKKQNLQNEHQAIFVAPTFSQLPWYADHPTDRTVWQETYFCDVVVPFIDQRYPGLADRDGRLLLGFSKSGWGAWSLLLRYPETFGRAAAWDAPLMMQQLGKYGTRDIFGTQENFDDYRIDLSLRAHADSLREKQRLVLSGYDVFHKDLVQTHELLDELKIPHAYVDGPHRKHDWHSGWVPEAVRRLVGRK
jgi:hypothetical protein